MELVHEAFSDTELATLSQLGSLLRDGEKCELRFYLLNPLSQERLQNLQEFLTQHITLIDVVEETVLTPSSIRIRFLQTHQALLILAQLLNQQEIKKILLGFSLFRP